jgi:hypothetical protein
LLNNIFNKIYQRNKNFQIPLIEDIRLNFDYYLSKDKKILFKEKGSGFIYFRLDDFNKIYYINGAELKTEETHLISKNERFFSVQERFFFLIKFLDLDLKNNVNQSLQKTKEENSILKELNRLSEILNSLKNFLLFNLGLDETSFEITNDTLKINYNGKTLEIKMQKQLPTRIIEEKYTFKIGEEFYDLNLKNILEYVQAQLNINNE